MNPPPRHALTRPQTKALLELCDTYGKTKKEVINDALALYLQQQIKHDLYGAKLGDEWPGLSFSHPFLFWGGGKVELKVSRENICPEIRVTDPFFGDEFQLGAISYGHFVANRENIAELVSRHDVGAPARQLTVNEAEQARMFAAILSAARWSMEVSLG